MNLKEFGQVHLQDNVYLVNVLNRKNAATSEPAVIAFGADVHNECNIFINKVRNKLTGVGVRSTEPSSLIGDQFGSFSAEGSPLFLWCTLRNLKKTYRTCTGTPLVFNIHQRLT